MKAITSAFSLSNEALPQLEPNHALVRVKFFGVTQDDVLLNKHKVPVTKLGTEFSGEIKNLAPGTSTDLKVGDRVVGYMPTGGAMAQYVVCDLRFLLKMPPALSYADAAGIPSMWVAALQLLKHDAEFKQRHRVAVFDAMSSVGQAIVQLTQLLGCRRVHCIVSSRNASESVRQNLTFKTALRDEVIPHIDAIHQPSVLGRIAAYDSRGLEAVIDLRRETMIAPEMLRPQGRAVVTSPPANSGTINWELMVCKQIKLHATSIRSADPKEFPAHVAFLGEHILPKIMSKSIFHSTAKIFSWRDTRDAFAYVESNPQLLGRVVCAVD